MKNKGFTLLELMAVVVIISILASIAMPIYTRSIERARAVEAMANIKALNDAVYAYYADTERCPSRFTQLVMSVPGGESIAPTSGGTTPGSGGTTSTTGGVVGKPTTHGTGAISSPAHSGDYTCHVMADGVGTTATAGTPGSLTGGTAGTPGTPGSTSGTTSTCPESAILRAKFFEFVLGSAPAVVPGTPCYGVTAVRVDGGSYQYSIMNPYEAASLACMDANEKGQGICDALGI